MIEHSLLSAFAEPTARYQALVTSSLYLINLIQLEKNRLKETNVAALQSIDKFVKSLTF